MKLPFRSSKPASPYKGEAETFVSIMRDLAPGVKLDYSAGSIEALEAFISGQFDPPGSHHVPDSLVAGAGCYVGEVLIRTLGGHWNREGKAEINGIGQIEAIFPIQKVAKRFRGGPAESLSWYYQTAARHAREA